MLWYQVEPSPGTKERLWYRVFYLVAGDEDRDSLFLLVYILELREYPLSHMVILVIY